MFEFTAKKVKFLKHPAWQYESDVSQKMEKVHTISKIPVSPTQYLFWLAAEIIPSLLSTWFPEVKFIFGVFILFKFDDE